MRPKLLTILFLAIGIYVNAPAQTPAYQWAYRLGGNGQMYGNSIDTDNNGNSYVIGTFTGTLEPDPENAAGNIQAAGGTDVYFAKYAPDGSLLFVKTVGGTGNDHGYALAVDASGNIYIAGSFEGTVDFNTGDETRALTSSGNSDIFFAKYDTDGNYLIAHRIGGTGTDRATSLCLDPTGNLYLAGSFAGNVDFDPGANTQSLSSRGNTDGFFAKYSSNGNYLMAKQIGGTGTDEISRLNTDGVTIYTTGIFSETANFGTEADQNHTSTGETDIFIAKYDAYTGEFKKMITAGGSGMNQPNAITLDADRNIYITGSSTGDINFNETPLTGIGEADIFMAKYNHELELRFAHLIGSTGTDEGKGIAIDGFKNIYLVGTFNGQVDFDPGSGTQTLTSQGTDIFLAKYTHDGNYQFAYRLGGSGQDDVRSIMLDEASTIYLTGGFEGTSSFSLGGNTTPLSASAQADAFIVKYTQTRVLSSIEPMENISVPVGTAFDDLELPLIAVVTYNDGNTQELAVTFAEGNYNGNEAGVYTLAGTITLPPGVTNPNNLNPTVQVTVGTPTSSPLPLHASLSVYPNPSRGMFTIDVKEEAQVRILDMRGQVVLTNHIAGTTQLDISSKSRGLYIVQVTTTKGQSAFRLLLE